MTEAEKNFATGLIGATWVCGEWSDTGESKYRLRMKEEGFILDTGENSESVCMGFNELTSVIQMLMRGLVAVPSDHLTDKGE